MTTPSLPELPEPNSYCTHADAHEYDVFDADQMRAYALSALAADRAATAPDEQAPDLCPFCGSTAEAVLAEPTNGLSGDWWRVICHRCHTGQFTRYAEPQIAVEHWNRRVALAAPDRAANSLAEENDELHTLNRRLSDLLHRTANAIRGEPPPLTLWSFHDIPDRAAALVTMLDVMQRAAANLAAAPSVPPVGVGREAAPLGAGAAELPEPVAINVGMRVKLRHLVDLVTNHVTESELVLATDTIDRLIDEAMRERPVMGGRCPNCDDTGDVHSIDGEWRGICHCKAGDELRNRRAAPLGAVAVDAAPEQKHVSVHSVESFGPLSDAADPASPWIAVSEQELPGDHESYLVANCFEQVAPFVRGVIHNNIGTGNDWQWGAAITYWMPLPAPPAEQTP